MWWYPGQLTNVCQPQITIFLADFCFLKDRFVLLVYWFIIISILVIVYLLCVMVSVVNIHMINKH